MVSQNTVNKNPQEESKKELLPNLQIVPIHLLVPHEEHDNQRSEPLIQRIQGSGVWLNPPVVAPMGDGRYVILDGANRHFSLKSLGYAYILVQVVDYESEAVRLETWHHIVSGLDWFSFLRHLREIPYLKMQSADLLSARAALARRQALAYTVLADDQAYTLDAEADTLGARTAVLNEIVDTYKTRGVLNRINTDSLSVARRLYPNAVAIVVFPHYQPPEIIVAARDGIYLPPGISRHIIYGRAMRLNYPLEALADNGESLVEKNAALQRWIQERTAAKRVRFYAESTYLFDE
jgi:ParB-like nuclease domain